jgi:hypothetical protein
MPCTDNRLKTEHTHFDFLYYKLVTLPPFLAAIFSIARHSWVWTVAYLVWVLFHVFTIYRLLCTHCPHYGARNGKTCCHFIWSTPPIFRKRPGPLKTGAVIAIVFMLMISSLFPMYWLFQEPDLLVLYLLTLGVLFATMMKYECTRCRHLDCPKNQVKK